MAGHRGAALGAPSVPWPRFLLLGLGAAALATGVHVGLVRLGALPAAGAPPLAHGPLLVSGFLGTVIALERAVALGRGWAYLAPALTGAGALATALSSPAAPPLLAAGSVVVLAVLVRVIALDRALHHQLLLLGAASWLAGNVLLAAGVAPFELVGFWIAFPVATIAAERLELVRVLAKSRGDRALLAATVVATVAGAALSLLDRDLGFRLLGGALLAMAAWLLRHDVARRTIRQTGAVRYIAAALLAGYVWLGLAGVLALAFGHPVAGPRYDALLHAVFVGFVFSMIFGHALVIVPAVLSVQVPYRPRFWAHLGLLHASLALRIGGDLAGSHEARVAGSWLNVAAIVALLARPALAARRRGG